MARVTRRREAVSSDGLVGVELMTSEWMLMRRSVKAPRHRAILFTFVIPMPFDQNPRQDFEFH